MASTQRKTLDQPDETRPVEKGKVEVVNLDVGTVMRATFEPGWRWSECVKPIVGGESCQAHHLGYVLAGALHLVTDEGKEYDVGPGDVYEILPGHHAQVTGDVAFEALEFQSKTAETYAKK